MRKQISVNLRHLVGVTLYDSPSGSCKEAGITPVGAYAQTGMPGLSQPFPPAFCLTVSSQLIQLRAPWLHLIQEKKGENAFPFIKN